MTVMVEQETRSDRTQLSDLVRARRAELRLSLRALAERCVDPDQPDLGPLWKYGSIANLEHARPNITPPTAPQLRALAVGLDIPPHRVQDAAGAQFHGIDTMYSDSAEARTFLADMEQLTPEDRAKVMDIVKAWGSRRRSDPGEPDEA